MARIYLSRGRLNELVSIIAGLGVNEDLNLVRELYQLHLPTPLFFYGTDQGFNGDLGADMAVKMEHGRPRFLPERAWLDGGLSVPP